MRRCSGSGQVSGVSQFDNAVIVGGSGAIGGLFADALVAVGMSVPVVVDRRSTPASMRRGNVIEDDILRPSNETLRVIGACDLVILAIPEPVALAAVQALLPAMKRNSLLVDTLSVKSRYAQALTVTATSAELLGVNPMFAPSLGFAGRSVVAVPYRCGALAEAFLAFIAAQGADVVRLDAASHDQACAALQVATHASILCFGMALRVGAYDLAAAERIMPPPHRVMLALLGRIVCADPEVYRDIQAANPFASQIREDLVEAHRRLDRIVTSGDPESFRQLCAELRGLFAGTDTDYAALCARLFEVGPD